MAEYKANDKYFKLGESKDFRSIGGDSKHGRLVAGHTINMEAVPKQFEGCFDEVGKPKTKKKKESK